MGIGTKSFKVWSEKGLLCAVFNACLMYNSVREKARTATHKTLGEGSQWEVVAALLGRIESSVAKTRVMFTSGMKGATGKQLYPSIYMRSSSLTNWANVLVPVQA